jgi:hypothetical protein
MLVHPDDREEILPGFGANEPTAVALQDGSVLVLGQGMNGHTEQMRRLVSTPQGIVVEDKGQLPNYLSGKDVNYKARYGVAAVALSDGRVFTAGGGYDADAQRVALVDPLTGTVQAAADMPHKRTYAALVPLQDGRIVVAGHPHLRCYDQDVRTVDVYDPKMNQWQALPDLPLPLCADAYGADGPSGTELPDGTIVLGGYLEQNLMALHPDKSGNNGYANSWQVFGPTQRMRISGVLQAISNKEVVIAGGVHHLDFGGCCFGTPGAERVALHDVKFPSADSQTSFGLPLQGVGTAQRNGKLFIASGHIFSFTSTGQMRYSTLVELLDIRSGEVQQLPSLPFVTGSAQVAWLDDDRVLVKGEAADSNNGFSAGSNLSSYMPPSSDALAIFSIKDHSWTKPAALEQLKDTTLLAASNDEAIFISSNASIFHLRLSTLQVKPVTSSPLSHTSVTARQLADGRIVVAGGNMQQTRISLIDEACEMATDNPERDCAEQFTGWGALVPAVRYQWFTPSAEGKKGIWEMSEPATTLPSAMENSNSDVLQTIVDAEGRALRFTRPSDTSNGTGVEKWLLERSSADGKSWQKLSLPEGIVTINNNHESVVCAQGCRLQLIADPRQTSKELLFLREGNFEDDYASGRFDRDKYHNDADKNEPALHVWWLDETGSDPQWKKVLQADGDAMRKKPLPLTGSLSGIQSMGWHLAQPVLWNALQ